MEILQPNVRNFLRAFGGQWFTKMSGPLTVPLTVAAFFIPSLWAKILLAVLAIVCGVVASYGVWARERKSLIEAIKKIKELEWPSDRPQLLFHSWGEIPHDHPDATPHPPDLSRPTPEYYQRGFHFLNDGTGTAHDLKVWDFGIGSHVGACGGTAARVEAKSGGFTLVWMDLEHNIPFAGSGILSRWNLLDAMRVMDEEINGKLFEKPPYAVDVGVTYRDSRHVWYLSYAKMYYIRATGRLTFGPTSQQLLGYTAPEVPEGLFRAKTQ